MFLVTTEINTNKLIISVQHIEKWFYIFLIFSSASMGCSKLMPLGIDPYPKKEQPLSSSLAAPQQRSATSRAVVCFDFFNTLFKLKGKISPNAIESQLFPNRKNTLSTSDNHVTEITVLEGPARKNLVFAMFDDKIQFWNKHTIVDPVPYTIPVSYRNALSADSLVRSFLEQKRDWFRDNQGLRDIILFLLNQNYRIVFYAFLKFPCIIPLMLSHIGLTQAQISSLYIACASAECATDPAYKEIMWHIFQKVCDGQEYDYELILGDSFYKYAFEHNITTNIKTPPLYIAMAIPAFKDRRDVYVWKPLTLVISLLYKVITKEKEKGICSQSCEDEIAAQLKNLGVPYKIIQYMPVSIYPFSTVAKTCF